MDETQPQTQNDREGRRIDPIVFTYGPTKEAILAYARAHGLMEYLSRYGFAHSPEDYVAVSRSLPVYAVADGVTLDYAELARRGMHYPDPSPAGDVAKIFCEKIIRQAEIRYDTFDETALLTLFKAANSEVSIYNRQRGLSGISGNPTGLYAATGSYVVLKENKAFWAAIADAYVAHFNRDMEMKFMSSGSCEPYAVINGQEKMAERVESGVLETEAGDTVFLFSDGYEHYIRDPAFIKLFAQRNAALKNDILEYSRRMNAVDPEKFGHERSLIALPI
ncbi:MAG: protein phosphatase 2C domain-containing protein [Patescibacteria group bacterium]|nr:protein phosphatase 2C domain-containing protein [Patescibacteria group bacterium]